MDQEAIIHDGKGGMWASCSRCHGLVKINKWLVGSLHICVPPLPEEE